MQNLILKKHETTPLLKCFSNTNFIFDGYFKVAYIISEYEIYSFDLNTKQFIHCTSLQHDGNHARKIIYSCYIIEDELVFILFDDGKIITYDTINGLVMKHNFDSIQDNIDDAKFSYDQELLVISTKQNEMLLYNKLLVLKRHYDMNLEEYGSNEMVNVNWGSKSTQFHGQGMRDHRNVKEEHVPLFKWDDHKCFIEWKHDDDNFIINFVCSKGYRLLKIFNREGILQHTSEYVTGLEKSTAWKPSGTLIAASQLTSNSHEIIFFEKNGLNHSRFQLSYKPKTFIITKLSWSYNSSVLLICGFQIEFMKNDEDNYKPISQDILFFTQNNYCWYLKQRIQFMESNFIENVIWDENEYLKLHFTSSNGCYFYHLYELIRQTTDNGNVFLIDGNKLLVSDFNHHLVPPPLFTYSIKFNCLSEVQQIKQISHLNDYLVVFLTNDVLVLFKLIEAIMKDFDKIEYPISYNFQNICADFRMVYFPIFYENVPKISKLLLPTFDFNIQIFGLIDKNIVHFNYKSDKNIIFDHEMDFNCEIISLLPDGNFLLLNSSNQFYRFKHETNILSKTFENYENLYDEKCCQLLLHIDSKGEEHLIILTKNNSLYYDEKILMKSNVDSFRVYKNEYLLFTTFDSLFYCWPLNNFDLAWLKQNYPPRNLERGSKLLAISNLDSRVVVELPRGNLEAFHPRVLLLDYVNDCLKTKKFFEAFEILRRNRINLNYICDYDFDSFINHCHMFLEQFTDERIDWICLFLFELSSSNYYHILTHQSQVKIENKLNIVCDTFIKTMEQSDKIKFFKAILLSHVKKENPEIVEALNKIKNLTDSALQNSAITFLLSIIDMNQLLNEALGTYDFDILLMVAAKSNKDPREYLALIDNFKKIENENYRKFKIDLHLQRYKNCLFHLAKCPDRLDEALELIQSKHLFKEAIEIFDLNNRSKKNMNDGFKQIWNIYADYLFKKCYYEEAAIAYKRASNYLQAFKMYVQSSNWNLACVCARQACQDSNENFKHLLKSLYQNLVMNGHYIDAAYINERYLDDFIESFRILVKGHQWEQAIRLHKDYDLDELLFENEFKVEMIDFYEKLVDDINAKSSQISEYITRLKELQEISKNIYLDSKFDPDVDVYSDTTSVCDSASVHSYQTDLSINTLKTNRSQTRIRNAKKMEQKKYVLKRGSPNEDIQIIYAVKELISKCLDLFNDSSYLNKILYDLCFNDESKILQSSLQLLENKINESIEFIWNSGDYVERLENEELLKTTPVITNFPKWKIVLN